MTDIDELYNSISPRYTVELAGKVEERLWNLFQGYDKTCDYIEKWFDTEGLAPTIEPVYDFDGSLNVSRSLKVLPNASLIRMAMDLDIATPGFLPSIPLLRNILKEENPVALQTFDRAVKLSLEHPDEAVALACSSFEGLMKSVNRDLDVPTDRLVTGKLAKATLENLGLHVKTDLPVEVKTLTSSLIGACNAIFDLRTKSTAHGQSGDAATLVIDDPLWAIFAVNAISTIGTMMLQLKELKTQNNP